MFGFDQDGTCNWCGNNPCTCKHLTEEEVKNLPAERYSKSDPLVRRGDRIVKDPYNIRDKEYYVSDIDNNGQILCIMITQNPMQDDPLLGSKFKWEGPYKRF